MLGKVLIIASLDSSLRDFRGDLIKELRRQNIDVVACAPSFTADIRRWLDLHGVAAETIRMSRTGVNPLKDWQTILDLVRLLKRLAPNKVLTYTVKPVIYGAIAARVCGIGEVYSWITGLGYAFIQGGLRQKMVGAVVRRLYRTALAKNSAVMFQNKDDAELFQRAGIISRDMRIVITNGSGVNTEYYAPVDLPAEPVFLLIARLLKDKGVREYAKAAGMVKDRYPSASFLLVGWYDSNPSSISKEEVEAWERAGHIQYLGSSQDVRVQISRARVFVLPSYREGTPRSVLEAMSMGRPVITTDVPGCRETVIDGENGILVSARDAEALASAMMSMIDTPELLEKMGQKSREIAIERYDVRKVNETIIRTMSHD